MPVPSPLQGVCAINWRKHGRKEESKREESLPRTEALGNSGVMTGKQVAATGASSSHRTTGQGPPAGLSQKRARTVFIWASQDVSHRAVEECHAYYSVKTISNSKDASWFLPNPVLELIPVLWKQWSFQDFSSLCP